MIKSKFFKFINKQTNKTKENNKLQIIINSISNSRIVSCSQPSLYRQGASSGRGALYLW